MNFTGNGRKPLALLCFFAGAFNLLTAHAFARTFIPCRALLEANAEGLSYLPPRSSSALENLFRMVILPVLDESGRHDHAQISVNNRARTLTIKSPLGSYTIRLTDKPTEAYPRLGLPEISIAPEGLSSEIIFDTKTLYQDLERSQGVFRSALRADFYLHPHLRSNENRSKSILSHPQGIALAALMEMESQVKGGNGIKRGLVMPVGMGKTVVAAKYVAAVGGYNQSMGHEGWKKKPKTLFVVQNNRVLDRAVETFSSELDLKNIALIYDEGATAPIDPDCEMVAITRTSYFNRMSEIHQLITADPDQPWVIVFDEAHHLGTEDGEFDDITTDLHKIADARHRVLLLTPTPWHPDEPLITGYLGQNIHGAFLNAEEQLDLQNGRKLPELCRLQYYRGMQRGYLSPLYHLNLVRNVDGIPTEELLTASVADETTRTRTLTRYRSLLHDVSKRIKNNRVSGMPDRAVIYVDSQRRADIYAAELAELLGEEVRSLHSGPGVDPETFAWFSDKGKFETPDDLKKPKYLVVVDMFNEGVDIPRINLIVLLRRYGEDMGGFRNLIQQLGRGSRNFSIDSFFKLHLRLLDYSLYSRWLRDGLGQISVEPRDFHGQRLNRPPGYLMIDDEVMDALHFQLEYHKLFPRDGTFVQEFPFFDLEVFKAQSLRSLHELAISYAVPKFGSEFGAKKLMLKVASFLPTSPEKSKLIEQLEDDAYWGWKARDGVEAKQGKSESDAAVQRIFRALYRIAALQKLTNDGRDLELSKIHETSELEALLDQIDPQRVKSLTQVEHKLLFLDKDRGAWPLIASEASERHLGRVSDPNGLRILIEALAHSLPKSPERTQLLKRLDDKGDLAINSDDGQRLNSSGYAELIAASQEDAVRVRGSLNRCYRALYAIALILKQTPAGADLDLTALHERAGIEKLLNLLDLKRTRIGVVFTPELKDVFLNADGGGLRVFAYYAANLGVSDFSRNHGSTKTLWALAAILPDSKDRTNLIVDLNDMNKWKWGPKDGAQMTSEGYETASRRFFLGLCRIAMVHNRLNPHLHIDLKTLHTRDEAEKFYNYLILGFDLPRATKKALADFSTIAVPLIEARARSLGISAYVTNYGPKRMVLQLAKRLEEKSPGTVPPKVVDALNNDLLWGWTKGHGQMLKSGTSERSLLTTYRGFATIAYFIKTEGIELRLDDRDDINLLLDQAKP